METQNQIKRRLCQPGSIETIRRLLDDDVPKNRSSLAAVCQHFGFLDARLRAQTAGCVKALRELERAGHFVLPVVRVSRRGLGKSPRRLGAPVEVPRDVPAHAGEVRGLTLITVDTVELMRVWNEMMLFKVQRQSAQPKKSKQKTRLGKKQRTAQVELRSRRIELRPPSHHKGKEPITLWMVHVLETSPPANAEPVEWFLLTTGEVTTVEQAQECLNRRRLLRARRSLRLAGLTREEAPSYMYDMAKVAMSAAISVRISSLAVRRLQTRARARGVSTSALIRDLLEHEAGPMEGEPSALELTNQWVGALRSRTVPAGRTTRRALADWQPDRRG